MQNSMVVLSFSVLEPEIPFWSKFGWEIQNCHFKLKFGTLTDSNKYAELNGAVLFLYFWPKIPFLDKCGARNQNYQFKLKLGTETSSNMQNSMAMFIFSVFDLRFPFGANLVQKVKIISLS